MLTHKQIASDIIKQTNAQPKIGVVLGSGWSEALKNIRPTHTIKYESLKNMPKTTVKGHEGNFIFANINGKEVAFVQGRFHLYEGYSAYDATLHIRILAELGVKTIIITNSAGSVNESYNVGDIVVINDHINLTGHNPLTGLIATEQQPIFIDMTTTYNKNLCEKLYASSKKLSLTTHYGTYLQLSGPNYETPAEIAMAKTLGADLVGMSTVIETIMARYENIKVCALSCITNKGAGLSEEKLNHQNVLKSIKQNNKNLSNLLSEILKTI